MSLILKSLSYLHPDREPVFSNLNLAVGGGEHVSVVGNNGAGKSTLLGLAAGKLLPAAGEVIGAASTWLVAQHLEQFDELSVAAALGIDAKIGALQAILSGDADQLHFDLLQNDWDIEDRLTRALHAWGLVNLNPASPMKALSGGEKTRVLLAGIAIHEPALILLDEPTNHLDGVGRERLYHMVQTTRATVVLVSHDRCLLNCVDKTIELSPAGLEVFGGNYDFYREQKRIQTAALHLQAGEQEKMLRQLQEKSRQLAQQRQKKEIKGKSEGKSGSMPRIIAGGLKNKAQQTTARSMEVVRERAVEVSAGLQDLRSELSRNQEFRIDLAASGLHEGKVLIDAEGVGFAYHNRDLFSSITFQLRSGSRLQISGSNGAGKTTLVKLLTGTLLPTAGQLRRADFSYLYLDQQYSIIDPQLSVYEQLARHNGRQLMEHELKSILIYARFPRESWDRSCRMLSGGEKMKLALCCLSTRSQATDMLILDEPTNNLDLESLDILTASVKTFNGTLILISHDTHFANEVGITQTINL